MIFTVRLRKRFFSGDKFTWNPRHLAVLISLEFLHLISNSFCPHWNDIYILLLFYHSLTFSRIQRCFFSVPWTALNRDTYFNILYDSLKVINYYSYFCLLWICVRYIRFELHALLIRTYVMSSCHTYNGPLCAHALKNEPRN